MPMETAPPENNVVAWQLSMRKTYIAHATIKVYTYIHINANGECNRNRCLMLRSSAIKEKHGWMRIL
jgi:hypothetical protein